MFFTIQLMKYCPQRSIDKVTWKNWYFYTHYSRHHINVSWLLLVKMRGYKLHAKDQSLCKHLAVSLSVQHMLWHDVSLSHVLHQLTSADDTLLLETLVWLRGTGLSWNTKTTKHGQQLNVIRWLIQTFSLRSNTDLMYMKELYFNSLFPTQSLTVSKEMYAKGNSYL